MHEQHTHGSVLHLARQLGQVGEAVATRDVEVGAEQHRAPDVASHVVEDVDRGRGHVRLLVLGTHAAGESEARLRRELARQTLDGLGRHARALGDGRRGVCVQQCLNAEQVPRPRGQPLGHDDVSDREGQQGLASRHRSYPLVGAHAGHAHAGLDVDVAPHLAVAIAVALGESARLLDRAQPGLEEVDAEREDVAGRGQVVAGHRVRAEHLLVRRPQRLVPKWLVDDPRPGAHCAEPLVHQPAEAARLVPRDEPHLVGRHLAQPIHDALDRIIPRYRLELAVRSPRQRLAHPVGVVHALERGLPARAQLALVDRVLGVPLHLHHAALAHPGVEAAPRRTLATARRIYRRDAGNLVLRGNEVGDELLDAVAPAAGQRRRAATGHTEDLEEPSPVHLLGVRFLVGAISHQPSKRSSSGA